MTYNLLLTEKYREILEKLYKRHKSIEEKKGKKQDKEDKLDNNQKKGNNIKDLYYLKSLAQELNKTEQAISETVKLLVGIGVVDSKEASGPNKGKVKYLYLTEDGLLICNVMTPPTKDEIKTVIINRINCGKELHASDIAMELGKNPEDKSIMDLIYAVMALPEVKKYRKSSYNF
jgi:hypothetical protein